MIYDGMLFLVLGGGQEERAFSSNQGPTTSQVQHCLLLSLCCAFSCSFQNVIELQYQSILASISYLHVLLLSYFYSFGFEFSCMLCWFFHSQPIVVRPFYTSFNVLNYSQCYIMNKMFVIIYVTIISLSATSPLPSFCFSSSPHLI
jgi:hypothetical protein